LNNDNKGSYSFKITSAKDYINVRIFILYRITNFDTVKEYIQHRKGNLAWSVPIGAFLPTTPESKENDWPELQMHLLPHLVTTIPDYKNTLNFDDEYWNGHLMSNLQGRHGVTYSLCLLRPKSRFVHSTNVLSINWGGGGVFLIPILVSLAQPER